MTNEILLNKMIEHRRYLHAHPELGHQEFETQKYIIKQLETLNLTYQTINTSTICDLIVDPSYPTIAMRADIDALAITEENECEYKSQNEGVMHACGHDGHTAIQLGVISYLVENKQLLNVNIRFIFQCDEESDGGAEEICEAGYLKGIEAIYGVHLDPDVPLGSIGYNYGQMNAGGDEVDIIVNGKQAHGAYPHLGVDGIVCAAAIVTHLQQIVSRTVDPLDSTVITIGSIDGPGTPNTICKKVTLRGTIRNLRQETRERSVEQVISQTKLIGEAHNCDVEVVHYPSYPPLVNDDSQVDYVIANSKKLGFGAVDNKVPSLGLEDFAYYLMEVPGAFYNVGTEVSGEIKKLHNSKFDFDEQALLNGALVQIENAINFRR